MVAVGALIPRLIETAAGVVARRTEREAEDETCEDGDGEPSEAKQCDVSEAHPICPPIMNWTFPPRAWMRAIHWSIVA